MTSTATLGFDNGGPRVVWRVDPDSVDWNWKINTSVTSTIGGRVVQVIGATLSDVTIVGSFGQSHGDGPNGESWVLAEAFYSKIREMMAWQSRDASDPGKMQPPAVFTLPSKNWRFSVYIKDLTDPDGGGAVTLSTGKFSHRYQLTLFIVEELSDALVKAGTSNGVLNQQKAKAIDQYLARINDGIGWHFSQFNGNPNPSVADLTNNAPGTGGSATAPPSKGGGGGSTPPPPPPNSGNQPGKTTGG